jgi:DNA-binding NarL/FixJ family response regulator
MFRVVIADDHAVVRRGLMQILAEDGKIAEVGEAGNACDLLTLVRQRRWDAVVLDITMPGRNGLDVLKELRQAYPQLPVLILSIHPEDQFATRALRAGASGYMTKESAPEELVGAIKKILKGGKYVSQSLAEKLVFELENGREGPPEMALSDREHEVMLMIASGKTVSEIAEDLALSIKTISTYRSRVLEKMGMKTNAELTRYAIQNELVN